MQPEAASLVMHMRSYIRGVATIRIYPYSAWLLTWFNFGFYIKNSSISQKLRHMYAEEVRTKILFN